MVMLYEPPLCPAGHLPLKGGDWLSSASQLPISLPEGEMAGRPEGGCDGTPTFPSAGIK